MSIFLSTALAGSVFYAEHIEIFMLKYVLYEMTQSQHIQHQSGTEMVLCKAFEVKLRYLIMQTHTLCCIGLVI